MRKNLDTVEEFWSWHAVVEAHKNADEKSVERFSRALASFLGTSESTTHLTPSGKLALETLIRGRKDAQNVVLAPALNCGRVKDAIEGAGCEVKTYDFHPEPGKFDWDLIVDAATPEVGVLIVTHYYGVPVDLRKIRDFCSERGIILIEDCAQTLGGYVGGQQVGTWGDAAIFSFSYDKPISLGWGGVALVNCPDKFVFEENFFNWFFPSDLDFEIDLLGKFVKSMEVRRSRIRCKRNKTLSILRRFYRKLSRATSYNQELAFGAIQAELGVFCLERYAEVRAMRNSNAEFFSSLCPLPTWPVMNGDIEPAWLKQKVFVPNPKQLAVVSNALQKRGIRAGNFNWPRLIEGEGSRECPNASQVATCWMDVPIHQRMDVGEIEAIVSVIKECT